MSGGIIYLVTCRATGKNYVGQTVRTLARRWSEHQLPKRQQSTSVLFAAIQKYGADAFDLRVLEEVSRTDVLNEREMYWSTVYNSLAPGGYNLKVGDGKTSRMAESVKRVLAAHNRERAADPAVRARVSTWMRNRWNDPETRTKMLGSILSNLHVPDVEARRSATQSVVQRLVQGTSQARKTRSAISTAIWGRPKTRRKILAALRAAMRRPEVRTRMSAAAKERARRPGAQARRIASRQATRAERDGAW